MGPLIFRVVPGQTSCTSPQRGGRHGGGCAHLVAFQFMDGEYMQKSFVSVGVLEPGHVPPLGAVWTAGGTVTYVWTT